MKSKTKANKLRQRIIHKLKEIPELQEKILGAKKMISGSLIKRYLGTTKKKRSSYAFYLSAYENGKPKLRHISKKNIEEVKIQVAEWKKYRQNLRQWRELIKSIDQDFIELGKIQNQLKKEK